jgi:hypothetical protein
MFDSKIDKRLSFFLKDESFFAPNLFWSVRDHVH